LKAHLKMPCGNKKYDKKYACSNCEKSFPRKNAMYRHMQAFHEEMHHDCTDCYFKTNTKEKLSHHRRLVHDKIKYPCNLCDRQFNYKML